MARPSRSGSTLRSARQAFASLAGSPGGRALFGPGLKIQMSIVTQDQKDPLRMIANVAPQVAAAVERVIDDEAHAAVRRIQAQWPVDTGASRAAFTVIKSSPLDVSIVNPVSYSGHVHRSGERTPLALTLVPREVQTARQRIAAELRRALQLVAQGVGSGMPGTGSAAPGGFLGRIRAGFSRFFNRS